MKWMTRLAPVAVFAVIAMFLAIGLTRDPQVIPTEMIDKPFPAFELPELREDSGAEPVTLDVLNGQPSLVNVFGSWCVACLQEHPTLMDLAGDDSVKIVGINWRDTSEDALRWLARHGDPYDHIAFDAQSDLAIELGVTGAPETFIVDGSGRIRYKQIGPITPDVWRETIQPILIQIEAEATQ
ncbi:MAG: DsbE family thiol:disulfide interchange protein [Pseudomonadota bacterium]